MSKLTVYKVSWVYPFINRAFSDLFFSLLEAKVFLKREKKTAPLMYSYLK